MHSAALDHRLKLIRTNESSTAVVLGCQLCNVTLSVQGLTMPSVNTRILFIENEKQTDARVNLNLPWKMQSIAMPLVLIV